MFTQASATVEIPGSKDVRDAIAARYRETEAERYGVTRERFEHIIAGVLVKFAAGFTANDQMALVRSLRVSELVLARACAAGHDVAWDDFISQHRSEMYRAARAITRDDSAGRELADGLYAELYGLPNRDGRRVSKLDYYMGRGSLQGWLRTLLAQQHVNRFRKRAGDVSLDEQMETGFAFATAPVQDVTEPDGRLADAVRESLAELDSEARFLLASYYLDRQTLAAIGRQLQMHESTISRKLDKITGALRKRIRKRLQVAGIDARQCAEMLNDLDVRDLNVNVTETLRQENSIAAFKEKTTSN